MFDTVWKQVGASFGLFWGTNGSPLTKLHLHLWAFLLLGPDVINPDQILSALQPPEAVVQFGNVHMYRSFQCQSLLLPAAIAAERLGQDPLAEYFAAEGETFHLQQGIVALCRAVRARVLQRRGDRAGAVELWRSAASQAMERELFMYAIRLGQDCGGELDPSPRQSPLTARDHRLLL